MTMQSLFLALNGTAFSQWLQASRWGLATIEMVHLIGLALFGGTLLLEHGRILWPSAGRGMSVRKFFRAALGGMVGTGLLLVAAEPMKCFEHPAFRAKMALFAAAILLEPWLLRAASRWASALSLVLWTGVGFFGRAIGFY